MKYKTKVLIILKRRQDYNKDLHGHFGLSTGLYNSGTFINEMLNKNGIESNISIVVDNNDIDREVTKYKPTHVIIEALWVVPSKFDILHKLHPKVNWIIRLHSQIPFLSNEGIAMEWIGEYVTKPNVYIAVNSKDALRNIRYYLGTKMSWFYDERMERVIYMPNFYPDEFKTKKMNRKKKVIKISCFGAIRPMKNHLEQAMAAIMLADLLGKKLEFHINIGRIEKGETILKNLESLFQSLPHNDYVLIKHDWAPRDEFLKICSHMDLGMQCSFSETFNIVSADLISMGVPVVGTKQIPWFSRLFTASPTNIKSIFRQLTLSYFLPELNVKLNKNKLKRYCKKSTKVWINYFHNFDTNKTFIYR